MPVEARASLRRDGAFDDCFERTGRDLFRLEWLTGSFHHPFADLIESHQRRVGLGLDFDLPFSAVGSLESVAISGGKDRVAMHDDLAILFLDGRNSSPALSLRASGGSSGSCKCWGSGGSGMAATTATPVSTPDCRSGGNSLTSSTALTPMRSAISRKNLSVVSITLVPSKFDLQPALPPVRELTLNVEF